MSDILITIADYAKERVKEAKKRIPLPVIREEALRLAEADAERHFAFEKALRKEGMSYILECKKASPSKGVIKEDFNYLEIAKNYEQAGASAISVLTEPKWFLGDIRYLREISETVSIPCLRKDFTVDEYMIYEAKVNGAGAVLLICSILTKEQLKEYHDLCDRLGLSALVEAHDQSEVEAALEAGARIIGVNNRNLRDFSVDPLNCLRLREYVPKDVVFVAESGIKSKEDINRLLENGVDAALIGEAAMKGLFSLS
ncbi:MAG: indole-3-glycerol phosphate synthase TrpC [Lachnospiraceae bacterium]|nr:indole-3-glycerol phosphate synthase TrpC [Lachnospiraceae bacterium]